jgi:hypothetical protein
MKSSETMNNQATAQITPEATELATKTKRKAASGLAASPQNAAPPTDGKVPTDEAIRLDAYAKWESAGNPAGDGVDIWLQAEASLYQLLATAKKARI